MFDKILLSLKYFSYICIVKCIGIFVFTFHLLVNGMLNFLNWK